MPLPCPPHPPKLMQIHCLGTAGYHPSEARHTSCYFLPEAGILFDAGTGLFRLTEHIKTGQLDILLSHAHLDHTMGLTFLLEIQQLHGLETVRVWGEAEKLRAIQQHLFSEPIFPAPLNVQWCPLAGAVALPGKATARWFPLKHPGGSVGYRIDWPDRSLAYVTDTTAEPDSEYIDAIRGVDLLLHECNFRDAQSEWAIKTGHSWATNVGELAAAAKVGQLVLVHLNPLEADDDPIGLSDVQAVFPRTRIARDRLVIDF